MNPSFFSGINSGLTLDSFSNFQFPAPPMSQLYSGLSAQGQNQVNNVNNMLNGGPGYGLQNLPSGFSFAAPAVQNPNLTGQSPSELAQGLQDMFPGLNPPNTLADCTGGAGGIIAPPWFIKVGVNPVTGATVGTDGVAKVGVYGV